MRPDDAFFDRTQRGKHDDRRANAVAAQLLEHVEARAAGQHQVENDGVELLAAGQFQSAFSFFGPHAAVTGLEKPLRSDLPMTGSSSITSSSMRYSLLRIGGENILTPQELHHNKRGARFDPRKAFVPHAASLRNCNVVNLAAAGGAPLYCDPAWGKESEAATGLERRGSHFPPASTS